MGGRGYASPAVLPHVYPLPTLRGGSVNNRSRLGLRKVIGEVLEGRLHEVRGLPEVWGEIAIGVLKGFEGRLHEVPLRPRVAAGAREAIGDAGKGQHLLQRRRPDDATAAGRRDEPHANRAAGTVHLHGHGVWEANSVPPVPTAHRNDGHFRSDNASPDRSRHLLGRLGAKADMAVLVAHEDIAHKAVTLAGGGHLLHGMDLHYLIR